MIRYTIPNSNSEFYFSPQKITKMLFQPDKLSIHIMIEGDREWEELLFSSKEDYHKFKIKLLCETE